MKKHIGKSIRIFKNPILESFTHVHPIVPLILWVPVILFLLYRGAVIKDVNSVTLGILFVFGFLLRYIHQRRRRLHTRRFDRCKWRHRIRIRRNSLFPRYLCR